MQLAIGKKSMALRIWPHRPHRPQSQQLRLPRADTANYLGASIEVVCRTLRDSWAKRLIDLPTRKTAHLIDPSISARLAED